MAAKPDYVFKKKKILKKFFNKPKYLDNALDKFEKEFLLEENIEYVLLGTASKIHYSRKFKSNNENFFLEKCIKEMSEYNR